MQHKEIGQSEASQVGTTSENCPFAVLKSEPCWRVRVCTAGTYFRSTTYLSYTYTHTNTHRTPKHREDMGGLSIVMRSLQYIILPSVPVYCVLYVYSCVLGIVCVLVCIYCVLYVYSCVLCIVCVLVCIVYCMCTRVYCVVYVCTLCILSHHSGLS